MKSNLEKELLKKFSNTRFTSFEAFQTYISCVKLAKEQSKRQARLMQRVTIKSKNNQYALGN